MGETLDMLREFVEQKSGVSDLQFDVGREPELPIEPYSKIYEEMRRTAHYLLLVASIDEGNVVGGADNARELMVNLYNHLGEELFEVKDVDEIDRALSESGSGIALSRLRDMIPEILASVNRFVESAGGDLIEYSRRFEKPVEMIDQLGKGIVRMGKSSASAKKKSCMYMRWMVRQEPDLRIFDTFSPKDLFVPLDKNVARVAVSLGVLESLDGLSWSKVKKVTAFARKLYPEDPVKVDYPFFLLGREIAERRVPLSREGLEDVLERVV